MPRQAEAVVNFKIFRSTFGTWEALAEQAASFAAKVNLISISHSADKSEGVIIVWYRER